MVKQILLRLYILEVILLSFINNLIQCDFSSLCIQLAGLDGKLTSALC